MPPPTSRITRAVLDWNGAPLTLEQGDNANLPNTPNGSMIFAYSNLSRLNNQGTISLSSGGGKPVFHQVPALIFQPFFQVQNWQANNLSVTNISAAPETPIWIEAVGPGIPGVDPAKLPSDGTKISLPAGQSGEAVPSAMGVTQPRYMNLVFQASTPDLAILAVLGGPLDPSGNNGFVFSVNDAANTGPGTGVTPPPGYTATTKANQYSYQLNWGSAAVFVANMSPTTSAAVAVSLYPL